jgi:hypothetical protein
VSGVRSPTATRRYARAYCLKKGSSQTSWQKLTTRSDNVLGLIANDTRQQRRKHERRKHERRKHERRKHERPEHECVRSQKRKIARSSVSARPTRSSPTLPARVVLLLEATVSGRQQAI